MEYVTRTRTCDGCGAVIHKGDPVFAPPVMPRVHGCSQQCASTILARCVPKTLPKTPADVQAARDILAKAAQLGGTNQ